jgi:hypothetical protein
MQMSRLARVALVLIGALLPGCECSPFPTDVLYACASDDDCAPEYACLGGACRIPGADSGVLDSGTKDAGADAGLDAGEDDAGFDAGRDAGTDAGVDAGLDAGVDAGTDGGLDAGPLPASRLVFAVNPSATAVSGFALAVQPRIGFQDALGRPVTDAGQSVTLAAFNDAMCAAPAAGSLQVVTNPLPPTNGVVSFDAVAYTGAGTVHLRASAAGMTSACSPALVVSGSQLALQAGVATDNGSASYGWASFSDLDLDGRPDLGVTSDAAGPRLFLSRPDASFAALRPFADHERAIVFGDCDNDGYRDVLVTGGAAVLTMYRNGGDGGFTNITATSNVVSLNPEGAAFLDYNRDGLLDVIAPSGTTNSMGLWRNQGSCVFTNATAAAMLPSAGVDNGEQVLACDYDVDGDVDVLFGTAQDKDGGGELLVFKNGGNGAFALSNVGLGAAAGLDYRAAFALGDYDNDGDFDLFIARFAPRKPALFRNNGNGTFTDVSATTQDLIGASAVNLAGATFGDLDNDGFLDLITVANGAADRIYRNLGGGKFALIQGSTGLNDTSGDKDSTGVALADLDLDGDLDPYLNNRGTSPSRLYLNASNSLNYLRVRVVGKGAGASPADATGAVVLLYDSTGTTLLATRDVSGGGAMGQNEALIHFGLANSWGGGTGSYVVKVRFNGGLYTRPAVVVPSQAAITLGGTLIQNAIQIVEP